MSCVSVIMLVVVRFVVGKCSSVLWLFLMGCLMSVCVKVRMVCRCGLVSVLILLWFIVCSIIVLIGVFVRCVW